MASATRTVRRLRLRATEEEDARRAAVSFEDALRVASLPDRAGCLLFIRRLSLPPMPPDASSQSIALALEKAVEASRGQWVHGGSDDVQRADVVWFADALDVHVHAARRVLRGEALTAWFWRLAIPEATSSSATQSILRALAFSLAAKPEAATALSAWMRILLAEGALPVLRAALEEPDLRQLAAAVALSVPKHPTVAPTVRAHREPRAGSGAAEVIAREEIRGDDVVAQLIEALAGVSGAGLAGRNRPVDSTGHAAPLPRSHRANARHPHRARERASDTPRAIADHSIQARSPTEPHTGSESASESMPGALQVVPGAWTSAGGLLFLLPVLGHLGYPKWIQSRHGWDAHDLPRRVLGLALARLGVPPEDPAWSLVERTTPANPIPPRRFVAPFEWRGLSRSDELRCFRHGRTGWVSDTSGTLLFSAWTGAPPRGLPTSRYPAQTSRRSLPWLLAEARLRAITTAWLIAARRWLRRRAGLGLASLVLRPAWVASTSTHVDVTFDLSDVDLRIRRSGLDLDPGWVGWFGRVVTFAYEPIPQAAAGRTDVGP